ncbi:carboxyl transferase domain-containing protein [Algiphilus sp.]|uniref:carboxyl transferase domain-containing protein n=1 Tax=Algiphilus sp. TaxID=1872431 RepID=UPI0025B90BFA|nr:carboxyl transferase domain-containing protein [Algiphilus sp.]MCK5769917.1 biotin/lipoyl-binding protein [Algiphilus sp.]
MTASAESVPDWLLAPTAAVVARRVAAPGEAVDAGATLLVLESMKMQIPVAARAAGRVTEWLVADGDTVTQDQPLARFEAAALPASGPQAATADTGGGEPGRADLRARLHATGDDARAEQRDARHARGYRTARENVADLCDRDSFVEYGQLAVAAQRGRRDADSLRRDTAADGVITGRARIDGAEAAVIVNDYSVLAGTQGYFHHRKLDRMLGIARDERLPVVMFAEGGGGRPGDTDVTTQVAGLELTTFALWAGLRGVVPRVAVANGYCFAGNAALFGAADITIATRRSWIGMAGPAMIEGGGLGKVAPTAIGPAAEQVDNGVVDLLAEDEADATRLARRALGLLRGTRVSGVAPDQQGIGALLPADRRYAYDVRRIVAQLFDADSVLELRAARGRAVLTALARLDGRPVGVLASDCRHLGGAIDAEAADKVADFVALCGRQGLPIVSLIDTPGFMVGPESEAQGAVRRMSRLFAEGVQAPVPWLAVFLRRGYGLGAMALAGGSFARPAYAVSWPSGEFGGMGLEGAVKLGYRRELEAITDPEARQRRFDALLAEAYERGRATEMAAHLELDAVIEPERTRAVLTAVLGAD